MMGLIAVCCIVLYGLGHVGNAVLMKARSQNGADAAALSAAYEIAHFSPSHACTAAHQAAKKNGVHVISCDVADDYVIITVRHSGGVEAQARAEID